MICRSLSFSFDYSFAFRFFLSLFFSWLSLCNSVSFCNALIICRLEYSQEAYYFWDGKPHNGVKRPFIVSSHPNSATSEGSKRLRQEWRKCSVKCGLGCCMIQRKNREMQTQPEVETGILVEVAKARGPQDFYYLSICFVALLFNLSFLNVVSLT